MKIEFDTKTMQPWHDISRLMNNCRSLKIVAGGETFGGKAKLKDVSGSGDLVLTIGKAPKRVVPKTGTGKLRPMNG